jgi:hypothetical protein
MKIGDIIRRTQCDYRIAATNGLKTIMAVGDYGRVISTSEHCGLIKVEALKSGEVCAHFDRDFAEVLPWGDKDKPTVGTVLQRNKSPKRVCTPEGIWFNEIEPYQYVLVKEVEDGSEPWGTVENLHTGVISKNVWLRNFLDKNDKVENLNAHVDWLGILREKGQTPEAGMVFPKLRKGTTASSTVDMNPISEPGYINGMPTALWKSINPMLGGFLGSGAYARVWYHKEDLTKVVKVSLNNDAEEDLTREYLRAIHAGHIKHDQYPTVHEFIDLSMFVKGGYLAILDKYEPNHRAPEGKRDNLITQMFKTAQDAANQLGITGNDDVHNGNIMWCPTKGVFILTDPFAMCNRLTMSTELLGQTVPLKDLEETEEEKEACMPL